MEQSKYVAFPIDNKHIMEEFSDVIHNGDYLEYHHGRTIKQAFYHQGLLWELGYSLGSNHFSVELMSFVLETEEVLKIMKERIMTLNNDEYKVKVDIRDISNGFLCQFLKQID